MYVYIYGICVRIEFLEERKKTYNIQHVRLYIQYMPKRLFISNITQGSDIEVLFILGSNEIKHNL